MSYIRASYVFLQRFNLKNNTYNFNDIPVENLTHVFFAFFRPLQSGVFNKEEPSYKAYMQYKNELFKLKERNSKVKLVVSIGGGVKSVDDAMRVIFFNSQSRATFINEIVNLINEGFDGIDFDYEAFSPDVVDTYAKLLEDVKNKINNKLLFITVGGEEIRFLKPGFDKHCDYVNVMSYGFTPRSTINTDYMQNLYTRVSKTHYRSVDGLVNTLVCLGVPKSKIVMGICLYTRVFSNTDGFEKPFTPWTDLTYEGPDVFKAYYDITVDQQLNAKIDEIAATAYYYDAENKKFFSFDNKKTLQYKFNYIKKNRMAGMFSWYVQLDYPIDSDLNCTKYIYDNLK